MTVPQSSAAPVAPSPLAARWPQLLGYWLDCVREDASFDARCPFADLGKVWLPLDGADALRLVVGDPQDPVRLPLAGPGEALARLARKERHSSRVFVGLPCWHDGKSAPRGGGKTLWPLLLYPLQWVEDGRHLLLRRDGDWPFFNAQALDALAPSVEERRSLFSGLGLVDCEVPPPPARLLATLSRYLPGPQPVDAPSEAAPWPAMPLGEADLAAAGWLTQAVLVAGDRPAWTRGLAIELERLQRSATPDLLRGTALAPWLADGPAVLPAETRDDFWPALPLGPDQSEAVRAAQHAPLTVITGPPGTGKSQVVVAILAEAWQRGQRVLFASRNHHAVDVVEERLRAVLGRQLAVRAGRKAGERDLRQGLIELLHALLTERPSDAERQARANLAEQLRQLGLQHAEVFAQLQTAALAQAAPSDPTAGTWLRRVLGRTEPAATLPDRSLAVTKLASLQGQLQQVQRQFLRAALATLPDQLDGPARRAIGQYRATLERLSGDELGGGTFASLQQDLERLFAQVSAVLPLWCVTNLSARSSLPLVPGLFDLVILDEASQCDIASAIPLLYRAKRAVIIGDPQQLRHIAGMARHADQLLQQRHGLVAAADQPFSYSLNSLFDLASTWAEPGQVHTLRQHFRSHPEIIGFANQQFYGGRLAIGTDLAQLVVPDEQRPGLLWTEVESRLKRPPDGGCLAPEEAEAVAAWVVKLVKQQAFAGSVGVVAPFRAQANRIRALLAARLDGRELQRCSVVVDTAHGLQGDERDVVVFSPCVGRNMPEGARRFLADNGHLLNVAVTRAKAVLHVFGDRAAARYGDIAHLRALAEWSLDPAAAAQAAAAATLAETDSPAEAALLAALRELSLPVMAQFAVPPYRLDLALCEGEKRLAVEVDGAPWHQLGAAAWRRDLLRDAALAAKGWAVLRLTAAEVLAEPALAAERVRQVWLAE